jgi:hypothetical protein
MSRKPASEKLSKDALALHLTTELDALNQSVFHARDMLMNKVNFFLILVTAIGSGLFLMAGVDTLRILVLPIACLVVAVLLLMGMNTLQQGLDLSGSAITYHRRAGRIRKWFVDQEPTVEPYMPFTVADNMPRMSSNFINLRGAESILLIMNSTLAGTLAILIVIFWDYYIIHKMANNTPFNDLLPGFALAFVLGVVSFIVSWMLQVRYVKWFMNDWDKRQEDLHLIHFPIELDSKFDIEKPAIKQSSTVK